MNDVLVGAISWKYDKFQDEISIYIMTITVFEKYRRYKIGK